MHGWKSLPLSDAHVAELQGAGIKYEVARARGYRTVERADRFDLRTEYGFIGKQTGGAAFPGLLVPMYAGESTPTHAQLKVADRRDRGDGKVGPKYETPAGSSNRLDVNPFVDRDALGDPTRRKWIVEGAKKADAADVTR